MEKRQAVNWFQILAVCSALGLGGTYVWSRQKQAAPSAKPAEAPVASPETANQATNTGLKPVANPEQAQRVVLSGSKSAIIAVPPAHVEIQPNQKPDEPRILMPGSKSGAIVRPTEIPVAPKQRTLLPGSKSMGPILEPKPSDRP